MVSPHAAPSTIGRPPDILSGVIQTRNRRRLIPPAFRHRRNPRHRRCPRPNHVRMARTVLGSVDIASDTTYLCTGAAVPAGSPAALPLLSHLVSITAAAHIPCLCAQRKYTTRRFTFGQHETETQSGFGRSGSGSSGSSGGSGSGSEDAEKASDAAAGEAAQNKGTFRMRGVQRGNGRRC